MMKNIRANLLLLLIILGSNNFVSCSSASEDIKIGVFNDIHYLSEQLMDGGEAIKLYDQYSGKNIQFVPEILDKVLADYLKSDISILLIPGDITKDGEKKSHLDFQKKLQPLKDKGVRVFVIPGNHDINMPNAMQYVGSDATSTESVTPNQFTDIYADCGYADAYKRDTASLSYVAELNEKVWLLAIDVCLYKQNTNNSYVSAGKLSSDTERWVVEVLDEAKKRNIQVIGMMHHGLVEHIMFQSTFFSDYIVSDWQRVAALLADKGMRFIFTGHFHANDITEFTSKAGNKIYDIETGSLSSFAFPYRFVEFTKEGFDIKTRNVTSIPSNSNLIADDRLRMQKRGEQLAVETINAKGVKLPVAITSLISKIAGKIFVQHLEGDEKMDAAMKESLQKLSDFLDCPSSMPLDAIEMDLYPADNNVKLPIEKE